MDMITSPHREKEEDWVGSALGVIMRWMVRQRARSLPPSGAARRGGVWDVDTGGACVCWLRS
uniref:Uncharacterized protein n=1 Tax=Arundo donax TaxID=35708 RepID=A0A0A9B3P9_ARUDO